VSWRIARYLGKNVVAVTARTLCQKELKNIMPTLVSIVITTYNGGKYLAEQLDSIVGQTYKNLEIIISDDASTDDTLAIAQRYAAADSRIILIQHEKNIGLHANLANALASASGVYIAISDQDDIWRKDKIETQMSLLDGAIGVYSDSVLIDSTGKGIGFSLFQSLNIKPGAESSKTVPLFFKNAVSGHTLLFHCSLLSMVLPFTDDFIFDHQLALAASYFGGLRFCKDLLVFHRIHGGNHTNAGLASKHPPKPAGIKFDEERRRLHRWRQQQRIQYLLDRVPKASEALKAHGVCDPAICKDIAELPAEMARYDQSFLNIRLFNLLRQLGNKHPYCRKLRLKRCFTMAKGKLWYSFFSRLGFR
jgi:glycosyltransferase involved in cell wall biosynthesis